MTFPVGADAARFVISLNKGSAAARSSILLSSAISPLAPCFWILPAAAASTLCLERLGAAAPDSPSPVLDEPQHTHALAPV